MSGDVSGRARSGPGTLLQRKRTYRSAWLGPHPTAATRRTRGLSSCLVLEDVLNELQDEDLIRLTGALVARRLAS